MVWKTCLIAIAISLYGTAGRAETITVDDDSPADYSTIAAAVADAPAGARILIGPGEYVTSMVVVDKKLALVGSGNHTVVKADGFGFRFLKGAEGSQISDLVITQNHFLYGGILGGGGGAAGVDDIKVSRVAVENPGLGGIINDGGKRWQIVNNRIVGLHYLRHPALNNMYVAGIMINGAYGNDALGNLVAFNSVAHAGGEDRSQQARDEQGNWVDTGIGIGYFGIAMSSMVTASSDGNHVRDNTLAANVLDIAIEYDEDLVPNAIGIFLNDRNTEIHITDNKIVANDLGPGGIMLLPEELAELNVIEGNK